MTFLDKELNNLAEEIYLAKDDVLFSDTLAISKLDSNRKRSARIKALALIQTASSFEIFLSKCIEKLNIEISNSGTEFSKIKKSILSLALHEMFNSAKDTEGEKSLQKRVDLLTKIDSDIKANLTNIKSSTIYGGKTPRKKHIYLIWNIYSISESLPPANLLIALDSLADSRNEIAHGEITTTLAGRRKTSLDILGIIDKISDLAIYIAQCFDHYIKNSNCRAHP